MPGQVSPQLFQTGLKSCVLFGRQVRLLAQTEQTSVTITSLVTEADELGQLVDIRLLKGNWIRGSKPRRIAIDRNQIWAS